MTLTNSSRLRARHGFSLLELLVTVILVGIVMSMAGVRVSAMMTQQKVIRAAGGIQLDMEQAFAIAGRARKPITLRFATSASAITLKVTNRNNDTTYRTTDFKTLGMANGDVTASSAVVTIFPNGFASDTFSVQISITKNSKLYKRRVRMSRAGMVKII